MTKEPASVPHRATITSHQDISSAIGMVVSAYLDSLRLILIWKLQMSAFYVICLDKIVTNQFYMRQDILVNLPKYNWSHFTQHISSIIMLYGDDSK